MKLLELLSEDWKDEINGTKAKFAINEFGQLSNQLPGIGFKYHSDVKYYDIIDGEPVKLTPEPRPADSIKLSECDGRHVITVDNSKGSNRRITYETHRENSCWYVRDFDGKWCQRSSYLVELVEEMELTNIKIYDMSK